MTEKLQQTIKEQIGELPKEMQEGINSFNWLKVTEEIGVKYELSVEEIEDFQLETLLVLIGSVDSEFYAVNIENQVETTKDKAEKIANEALEKIFTPINNTIKEKIKENIKTKNPDWKQSVDFVLSGGDYSVFMEKAVENERNATINTTPSIPLVRGTTTPRPDKGEAGRGF